MAKDAVAAPIERPLSRAYLRDFGGWSTAYPPGVSEPSTLREMENVVITQEGAVAVRPGLRSVLNMWTDTELDAELVGGFESFFLNDGSKALLFAGRQSTGRVYFRIARYIEDEARYEVLPIDDSEHGFSVPQGTDVLAFNPETTYVRYVQIDNKIFALSNAGDTIRVFWVGTEKLAKKIVSITEPGYNSGDRLTVVHPVSSWRSGSQVTIPTAETNTTDTLISTTSGDNDYNFAYFYSFNNEIGESAHSQIRVVKTQRRWSAWRANASNDNASEDQLVAYMPEAVWDTAVQQGATGWNLYMLTWSNQDNVPVEAVLLNTRTIDSTSTWQKHGWIAHTPLLEGQEGSAALPNSSNRRNYSAPPTAGQGLVAGDRLILTYDRANAAVIRWSSNQQGNYTNFSSSVGGGYKTLTSGNLYIPAAVKLWQNPQSVDTITILCEGVDGYSTSYYMAPSEVSGASSNEIIMGFEETTATPGTVSPYGCEVLNNALYHPLDMMLMKSTASNYNINHKSMTDMIANQWAKLVDKDKIVSASHDNRLYFLVHNPDGEELQSGCNGNEIWMCDTEKENTWSRWLIQAVSLHKLAIGGRLYLGVALPNTIAVLDPYKVGDDTNDGEGNTEVVPIPWKFETNTQGANRAHDAWAHVRQAATTFGNVTGRFVWGMVGYDDNGKEVRKEKTFVDPVGQVDRPLPSDVDDYLQVRRNLKEWTYYAHSIEGEFSSGQISVVQYRYAPVSVNVGYVYGAVETFEYNRSIVAGAERTTDNGIPQPMLDTRYP